MRQYLYNFQAVIIFKLKLSKFALQSGTLITLLLLNLKLLVHYRACKSHQVSA